MVKGLLWTHATLIESRRLRRGIRIKCRVLDVAASRPPSRADHFMGICLPRYGIGFLTRRGTAAGEPRYRQIETSPEKMYGTVLSNEPRTEFLKHGVGRG